MIYLFFDSPSGNEDIASVESVPMETTRVLASCHALTYVDDSLVGDPQEKALLQAVDWNLTKGRGPKTLQNKLDVNIR